MSGQPAGAGAGAGSGGGQSPTPAAAARQDTALNFLTGATPVPRHISSADQDIAAWLLMNSDLFPNAQQRAAVIGAGNGMAAAATPPVMPPVLPMASSAAALEAVTAMANSFPNPAAAAASVVSPTAAFGVAAPGLLAGGAGGGRPMELDALGGGVGLAAPPPPHTAAPMGAPAARAAPAPAAEPSKPLSAADKRRRRLEKNREIARNCRKRKRQRMLEMEEQLQTLSDANRRLQLRLKRGHDLQKKEDKRVQELSQIAQMVRENAPDAEVERRIHAYKDLFADYGKDRQAAVTYHLEQLRMLLLPTQVTKMCMWSLHQDDEFYDEEKNQTSWGGGIWNILCKELHITPKQKRALLGLRAGIKAQRERLRKSLRMLNDLEEHVKSGVDSLESEMLKLMKCVSPNQQARFLLWIERNQACMHMLNNLWKPTAAATGTEAAASAPTPAPAAAGAGSPGAGSAAGASAAAAGAAGAGAAPVAGVGLTA